MIPANLIINADDFGIDPRVSRAIALALEEGLINSFSVFPFTDDFHAAMLRDLALRFPDAHIGVHLSLVSPGEPGVSPGHPDGPAHFRNFLLSYFTGRFSLDHARSQWKAQIRHVGELIGGGRRVAHLDSHQHLHVLPALWNIAESLRIEFAIPRVRVPYESFLHNVTHRFPFGAAMQALAWMHRGADTPVFFGFRSSMKFTLAANIRGLESVLNHPERMHELMVHPALPPDVNDWGGNGDQASEAGKSTPKSSDLSVAKTGNSEARNQEKEMDELRKLKDFFRTRLGAQGAVGRFGLRGDSGLSGHEGGASRRRRPISGPASRGPTGGAA